MRILQLSNRIPFPLKDGAAIATYNFTKAAHDLGHEVTLLCMDPMRSPVREVAPELAGIAKVHVVSVDNRITALGAFTNLVGGSPYHVSRFISADYRKALAKLLDENEFDVIHFDGLFVAPYLETVRAHSKAPAVLRSHNVEHVIWKEMAAKSSGLRKWYLDIQWQRLREFEVDMVGRFDLIVPITEADKDSFLTLGCTTDIFVSTAGLDLDRYSVEGTFEFPSVLFVGSLDWMPNMEGVEWFLQEVWPEVARKAPGVPLYLAGKNFPDSLRKWELEGVEFLGEVDDAVGLMASKAVMIVPLFSGSGMRIKVLEGAALAKAIVTTPKGLEGIDMRPDQDVLVAETASAFADQVVKCVEHKGVCEQLGLSAQATVRSKYDNKVLVRSLIDRYQTLA